MQKLVENLRHKLGIFTENATSPTDPDVTESWRTICSLEAECVFYFFFFYVTPLRSSPVLGSCRELKGESYGIELLHAIGFVYSAKAKQFLASNQTFFGVGGWLHNVQGKYHVFSETCVGGITSCAWFLSLTLYSVSTLRSAIELKAVFDQIQQAEQSGTLSAEEKKRLEEQAAEKGLHALFKVRLSSSSLVRFRSDGRACAAANRARNWRSIRCCARRVTGC